MSSNNYEQARKRIMQDPALREYVYLLIEDPLLDGPTRYERPLSIEDEERLKKHYDWLCSATSKELIEWAEYQIWDFSDMLHGYISDLRYDIAGILSHTKEEWRRRSAQRLSDLIDRGESALQDRRLNDAGNFICQAILANGNHARHYHDERKKPLIEIGEKVRRHLQEGTHKSRSARAPKAVDNKIVEMLQMNPDFNAAELFRAFPTPHEVEENEPYRESEYIYYLSSAHAASGRFRKISWEGFRKRVRKVKKVKKV